MKVFDAALKAIREHRTHLVDASTRSYINRYWACHGCSWVGDGNLSSADSHLAEMIDKEVD